MYNTHGQLKREVLCVFSEEENTKPNCAWFTNRWWIGTVNGEIWKQVENAWANDTFGNWTGSPPVLAQVINLKVIDHTGNTPEYEEIDGIKVFRVGITHPFSLSWRRFTLGAPTGAAIASNSVVTIYSLVDGSVVYHNASPTLPEPNIELEPGSYSVFVQYVNIVEGLKLPPDAIRYTFYDYTTQDGRLSHYNPDENWGEVPANPNHPLRLERIKRVKENNTHDVEEYAQYLTSEEPRTGEGSLMFIQVGDGDFEVENDVFSSPARPLHKIESGNPVAVPFDIRASQISFMKETRDGRILLGGAIMDQEGNHPALWEWFPDTDTFELLGIANEACDVVCEQLLSTGAVTGIVERQDGKIILITLCSRHIYKDTPFPENNLPRYPSLLDGEPGGRSLVTVDNRVLHLTEALGRGKTDPETESFYGITVDVLGEKLLYGPGTISHVDSSFWNYMGKAYGVRSGVDEKLYITYYDAGWNKSAKSYRKDWIYLHRGTSINGRNMIFGFIPEKETARVVLNDGIREQVLEFDYRVRGLFVTKGSQAGYRRVVCPAKQVIDEGHLSNDWSVIVMDGLRVGEFWPDLEQSNSNSSDYIYYAILSLPENQEYPVYKIHVLDCSENNRMLQNNISSGNSRVRARVDSNLPIDDIDSYVYPVPMNRGFILPIEAYNKVEILVFEDEGIENVELPIIAKRG